MAAPNVRPGPDAAHAFRLGILVAAIAAVLALGALLWAGVLTVPEAGFLLLVCFPVYLLVAASVLSVWLGYDKDATDLRPVTRRERTGPR